MAIAGRVAIVPKGNWSADATYKRLDAVTYNNALFIAKKEVPVGMLPTNIEYWMKSIDGSQTIPNATKTQDGLMSKEDKTKIDNFKQYKPDGTTITADEDGTLHGVAKATVDGALSSTSTNPVQNKVVKGAVDELKQGLGVERARIDSLTKLPEGSTTGDAELQDIRVKADGTTATSAGNAVREQISELNEDIINIENELGYTIENQIELSPTIKIGAYSQYTKEYYPDATNYRCALIKASKSDNIYFTGCSYVNPFAMYYNGEPSSSTYISSEEITNTEIVYVKKKLTIPSGTKYIAFNNYNNQPNVTFHIYKDTTQFVVDTAYKKLACNLNDGALSVKPCKHNNTSDLVVVMKNRGGNNLFDFDEFYIVENSSVLNRDFVKSTTLLQNVTDWIMPFKMYAKQNTDGDNVSSDYFTGGNHRSNNTGTGGVVTAKMNNIQFIVDGIETTSYNGYCENIIVKWSVDVQGYNTTKSDGTGRYILTANYTLTIENGKFEILTDLVPKENIGLKRYYGYGFYFPNALLNYIGSYSNRNFVSTDISSNSGDKNTKTIYAKNDNLSIKLTVDNALDLGTGDFGGDRTNNAFVSDHKAYWWMVDGDLAMNANEHFYTKACYEFN